MDLNLLRDLHQFLILNERLGLQFHPRHFLGFLILTIFKNKKKAGSQF